MKSVNVHPDQQELFLGYASKQSLSAQQQNFEVSFIGGQPIWLFDPQQSLTCQKCYKKVKPTKKQQKVIEKQQAQQKIEESPKKSNQNNKQYTNYELTFIMQMYCPFEADHCYHRILYFFYCEHCKKNYKVFRQQANINYVPPQLNEKKVKYLFKTAVEKSYEFETSQYSKKELIKLLNKIKVQVHEEIIEEAQDENSEQDETLCQEMNNIHIPQELQENKNPQNQELIKQQNVRTSLDVKKDQNFEIYKKIMLELNHPQLLYVSPPIPYNAAPINHKHSCQQCGAPYKLEVQLTQQILMVGKSKQLAMMEWGSLFAFTCAASCQTKTSIKTQQLVIQIQHDAVKEEQVKQLKKKNKKRKKQQKRKSKSKSRSKSQSEQQQTKTLQNKKQQSGDWD